MRHINMKSALFLMSEPDKKDKRLRKDMVYLHKVFGEAAPFWLFNKVLQVRRRTRRYA